MKVNTLTPAVSHWLAGIARGAFRDASVACLLFCVLMAFVLAASGDRGARVLMVAFDVSDGAGVIGLARLAAIGAHAMLALHLTVVVAIASAFIRGAWSPLIWLVGRGAKSLAALHRGAA